MRKMVPRLLVCTLFAISGGAIGAEPSNARVTLVFSEPNCRIAEYVNWAVGPGLREISSEIGQRNREKATTIFAEHFAKFDFATALDESQDPLLLGHDGEARFEIITGVENLNGRVLDKLMLIDCTTNSAGSELWVRATFGGKGWSMPPHQVTFNHVFHKRGFFNSGAMGIRGIDAFTRDELHRAATIGVLSVIEMVDALQSAEYQERLGNTKPRAYRIAGKEVRGKLLGKTSRGHFFLETQKGYFYGYAPDAKSASELQP